METMDYEQVMKHFGTRYKLAQALGLSISSTYTWPKGYIPRKWHPRIAELMSVPPERSGEGCDDHGNPPC